MPRVGGWLPVFVCCTVSFPALAKPILAVFDVENRRAPLSAQAIDGLTDFLVARIAAGGAFEVVPREQVKARLVEQKKESYRSCYAESCQIELGKELAAQLSLSTVVLRIGSGCEVTATLYDLARATAARAATAAGPCTEDGVKAAIRTVADDLGSAGKGPEPEAAPDAFPGLRDGLARSFVQTGEALLLEGRADEALSLFQRAYEREAHPGIQLRIARCLARLDRPAEARKAYVAVIQSGGNPADVASARTELEGVLDRIPGRLRVRVDPAEARVEVDGSPVTLAPDGALDVRRGRRAVRASLAGYGDEDRLVEVEPGGEVEVVLRLRALPGSLAVACDCPGARVLVDGAPVGNVPLGRPVEVQPGDREVQVLADGRQPFLRRLRVLPGAAVTVEAELPPVPRPVSPSPRPVSPAPEGVSAPAWEGRSTISPWHWVMLGTGVAALAAGGVCSGLAAGDRKKVDGAASAGGVVTGVSQAQAYSLESSSRLKDKAALGLYVAGGAAVVTGVVLWIVSATRPPATQGPTASFSAAPLAGGGAILGASGSFR